MKVPFNKPTVVAGQTSYFGELAEGGKYCGDGAFTKQCSRELEHLAGARKVLLTGSCTQALELSALLLGIKEGDEVIMPSFTFVSTANAFVLRGATVVFVDVEPLTMNISLECIERAISKRTKAIVVVHYAGVACDMAGIAQLSAEYGVPIIEDAAQAVDAYYAGRHLGTFGEFGCLSFHETKNIHCGEGGAILINTDKYVERCEILREKGTDRSKFLRGEIDKYTWVDVGSSYLNSEITSAFLLPQLESVKSLTEQRLEFWNLYRCNLADLAASGRIVLPHIPEYATHNAHIFFIKTDDLEERSRLMSYLKAANIVATFHYVPLHTSLAGRRFGRFEGVDKFTTRESERLLRLPLFSTLSIDQLDYVSEMVCAFYRRD